MYRYLRGIYKGAAGESQGLIVIEVNGIGFEVMVPPLVEQEIGAAWAVDDALMLYVSAQTGRDQPWPLLFGFLRPEEREFWELLTTVPRMGGKGAARAMAVPVWQIAQAIQDGNKLFLDNLPGVTLDGAEKLVAALRKKVAAYARPPADAATPDGKPAPVSAQQELRDDAVQLLAVMGVKRPDAERAVVQILSRRDELEIVSVQDVITAYLRAHQQGARP